MMEGSDPSNPLQSISIGSIARVVFDLVAGVCLPIVCLILDPIVFQGGGGLIGRPLLKNYAILGYGIISLEIGVLLSWLAFRRWLGRWSALWGGALLAGGIFSLLLGTAILPTTVVGLMMLIGVLGFVPFLTTYVYLRNGSDACKKTGLPVKSVGVWGPALLGAALVLIGPA